MNIDKIIDIVRTLREEAMMAAGSNKQRWWWSDCRYKRGR